MIDKFRNVLMQRVGPILDYFRVQRTFRWSGTERRFQVCVGDGVAGGQESIKNVRKTDI